MAKEEVLAKLSREIIDGGDSRSFRSTRCRRAGGVQLQLASVKKDGCLGLPETKAEKVGQLQAAAVRQVEVTNKREERDVVRQVETGAM
ncbi:hypothetical protein PanWU01x14_235580 [Parasponia andersonii]|uniref:Uncharacterized protein n=1 Tax=Parasponia andersonii TaxID=3476 RepID=A0A2P5BIQ7_PARAD|nr:hypothetical protein PanWU01x14_235580 [Parasponia andersonii]